MLLQPPRGPVALQRQGGAPALEIARGHVDERPRAGLPGWTARRDDRQLVLPHVTQHAGDVTGDEIDLERPRGVGVTDREGHVGHRFEHHPLVGDALRDGDGFPLDGQPDPAQREQVQPGRGHDHVRLELRAGPQPQAGRGERLDVIGHHLGLAGLDRREEVTVGYQAHALVPGFVSGLEVLVHVVPGRQALDGRLAEHRPHPRRVPAAQPVQGRRDPRVLPSHGRVGLPLGQHLAQQVGERIAGGQRHDERRRALQHGDMGRDLSDGRDQRDGGRAAADDHDPLAGEVETVGPVLRMHHEAGEVLAARPGRLVALVVSVVARAQVEEAARPGGPRAGLGVLDRHGPPGLAAGPVRAEHPRVVADLPVDAVGGRRFPEVAENIRAAGDRLGVLPRAEGVTEGKHVRVRPDAGKPEQVPRPAAGATRLDDRVRDAGGIGLQAAGGADTGQAGPHNQDVYMGRESCSPCSLSLAPPSVQNNQIFTERAGVPRSAVPDAAPRLGACARNCLPPPGPGWRESGRAARGVPR